MNTIGKIYSRIYKVQALVIVIGIICSCGNYLDVRPQGEVIPETDEEFASIIHNHLREIEGGGDEYIIGNMDVIARLEGCADNLDANIKAGNIVLYVGETINTMQLYYQNTWEIIRDCNIVIENLIGRESDTAKGALSAAYAIKGVCYYNLIRIFCQPWDNESADTLPGIPIVETFDISAMPSRGTLRQAAEYADKMFTSALEHKSTDPVWIFTEWVIKSYRAKLSFWCEDWDKCISICSDILDNSGFKLTPPSEYAGMINSANEAKGEVIVRSHINNSSELDWYFSYVKNYISSRPVSADFIRLFGEEPENDIRYAASFNSRRQNVKVPECKVRLSEMVLMIAEAYYHIGDTENAIKWLNHLRDNRIDGAVQLSFAGLPPVRDNDKIKVDATGKPITPLLQTIFDERRKELYMEADRWFELKRNGRPEWWIISNGLKYTTKEYLYTAPISKHDVDLNQEIVQNPGYVY